MAKKTAKAAKRGAPRAAEKASPTSVDPKRAKGMLLPREGVRVRMYRHGFGDCFLVSFTQPDETPVHMVIDCGLLPGSPDTDRVRAAVEDIRVETGGRIDVLVCTHEHADHLSGFKHAEEVWNQIEIDQLWLAWTEDPGDETATQLREQRERRRQGLVDTRRRLKAAGSGAWASTAAAEVDAALSFFGASESKTSTEAALNYLRGRVPKPRYFEPGDIADCPRLSNVRFFVLGPPRDEAMLKKDKPSTRHSEVYHAAEGLTADAAFFAAAADTKGGASTDAGREVQRYMPFESVFSIPAEMVTGKQAMRDGDAAYLHDLYQAAIRVDIDSSFVGARAIKRVHRPTEQDWRRIDDDWLGAAGSMALKLDSDTNNTSLVMAIELGDGGPVLLFPGDAQVGSWLSWDDCRWQCAGPMSGPTVTTGSLLARTVLYKVGHHGSHNATLKERGLERMTSEKLVAMIPVDEVVAKRQGTHGWKMPFGPLMDALKERTCGRILRLDADSVTRGSARSSEWGWFEKATRVTPLFIDYVVETPS